MFTGRGQHAHFLALFRSRKHNCFASSVKEAREGNIWSFCVFAICSSAALPCNHIIIVMISRITCSKISLLLPFCDSLVQGDILFSSAGLEQILLWRSFPWHITGAQFSLQTHFPWHTSAQFSLLEFISILQLRVLQVRVFGTRFPFKTTHQKLIFLEMGE